jgi:hypothetical protein
MLHSQKILYFWLTAEVGLAPKLFAFISMFSLRQGLERAYTIYEISLQRKRLPCTMKPCGFPTLALGSECCLQQFPPWPCLERTGIAAPGRRGLRAPSEEVGTEGCAHALPGSWRKCSYDKVNPGQGVRFFRFFSARFFVHNSLADGVLMARTGFEAGL